MANKTIITIGRHFGSGGREIGAKLAETLGVPFYDRELITMAAQQGGLSPEALEHADEKATSSLLYALISTPYVMTNDKYTDYPELPINDRLFYLQSNVIREAANKGSCVIVGRCADYVLKDNPDAVHVFISAPLKARIDRIVRLYDLTPRRAAERIQKIDKQRASYYSYYANRRWGALEDYNLVIDSSRVGTENAVKLIQDYLRMCQDGKGI